MINRQDLVDVALGRISASVVIMGGTLVDVCTRSLVPEVDIAVYGERIALVGDASHTIGKDTQIIDAEGLYLVPGFVDSHYHIESSRLSPRRHAQITLPRGTTTIIEDSHEICNALGLNGIYYLLEETEGLFQKVYISLSSATPPTPYEETGGYIGGKEAEEALKLDRVVGIGEVMDYARLFNRGKRLWEVIETGLKAGKIIEGHGVPSPPETDAWLSSGISSTHFSGNVHQALELLQRGTFLELKPSTCKEAISGLIEASIDWQMVGICVDDRPAELLLKVGHMDHEVREAIKAGLDPLVAYQLATINNARHWRIDGEVGIIAPGRYADILFISDLERVKITKVMANGKLIAERGKLVVDIPLKPAPDYVRNSLRIPRALKAKDFEIRVSANRKSVKAVVLRPHYYGADIEQITEELEVRNGVVQRDLGRGINKVAIVDRYGRSIGISFWKVGYEKGAVAMSVLHDSHNISVIGATDEEMAFAVNRVVELGGGIVVVKGKNVLAEVSLPIGGLMTDRSPDKVIRELEIINERAKMLKPDPSLEPNPIDTQTFLFLTCYPRKIMLTAKGLINLQTGEKIPPVW